MHNENSIINIFVSQYDDSNDPTEADLIIFLEVL